MEEQMIVALGREFGSGGHEIARKLAEFFGVPLYDQQMLEQIAEGYQVQMENLEQYDESPRKLVFSRRVHGFSNAPEDSVAQMQFRYMREQAEAGTSFIVLGRCAEEVLKEYPGLISIFVRAEEEFKIQRILDRGGQSEQEAQVLMLRTDRRRKLYHNQFCTRKWGEAETYDLIADSSALGIDGTAEFLKQYILMRREALAKGRTPGE